jgi:phospholipase C
MRLWLLLALGSLATAACGGDDVKVDRPSPGSGTSPVDASAGGRDAQGGTPSNGDAGTAADGATRPDPAAYIKHVVVVVKENHTFDNYFGSFPNAEGTTKCPTEEGTIDCPHAPQATPRDLCHDHSCALTDWNGGKMNGWGQVSGASQNGDNLVYAQYLESDIPNYWQYARKYALADHFFSEMLGPSFPGHMMFLAAQAGWSIGNPATQVYHPYWGCDQASGTTMTVLDNGTCNTKDVFPCLKIPSLPDVLPSGVDWKFYGTDFYLLGEIWSMFDGIDEIRNGSGWNQVVNASQWATDISNHALPAVTWLVDQDLADEHPGIPGATPCTGENWTVQALNPLMQSEYWKDTVVFISYDDFGGWYDHVAPPRQYGCDAQHPYGLGFRLPLIIVSPWVKPGSVFHEVAEQASIPAFIEKVFHASRTLSSMDPAAQDGQANDLLDAFDFTQKPNDPLVLQTRTCP